MSRLWCTALRRSRRQLVDGTLMLTLDRKLTDKATEVARGGQRNMTKRMGRAICDIAISADGYSAGLNQTEERPFGDDGADGTGRKLHAWMFDTPDENRAESRHWHRHARRPATAMSRSTAARPPSTSTSPPA
jgi:hypothetical protein